MTDNKRNLLIILAVGVTAAAFGALLIVVGGVSATMPTVDTDMSADAKAAPDFELELFSGKTIKLSDFKGEKPVIINFWASWCGPCREEAPILAKAGKNYGSDVEFIGIVTNDTRENSLAFMKEFDITYENGIDRTGIAQSFKITGIPETFWIDKDGRIVDHWIGAIDEPNLITRTERLIDG